MLEVAYSSISLAELAFCPTIACAEIDIYGELLSFSWREKENMTLSAHFTLANNYLFAPAEIIKMFPPNMH